MQAMLAAVIIVHWSMLGIVFNIMSQIVTAPHLHVVFVYSHSLTLSVCVQLSQQASSQLPPTQLPVLAVAPPLSTLVPPLRPPPLP